MPMSTNTTNTDNTVNPGTKRMMSTRKMVVLGALSAIAYAVMVVGRVPVVLFLKYDPKDVVITIAGFLYGPLSAAMVSGVVSLVEMFTVSDTGLIGLVMNVLATCSFACTASIIYKRRQTVKGAVVGLVTGWLLTTVVMLLWNYLLTPIFMAIPRSQVVGLLVPAILPFNLLKGGLNAALILLIYKPLVRALRGANLLPAREGGPVEGGQRNVGVMLVAGVLLVTCILLVLVLQGKI